MPFSTDCCLMWPVPGAIEVGEVWEYTYEDLAEVGAEAGV